MNRNWEGQKIRQLFREARRQDESRAPSFVETLAAARAKNRWGGWRLNVWRVAFVAVALMAIGIAAFVFFGQSTTQPLNEAAAGSEGAPPESPHAPVAVDPSTASHAATAAIKAPRADSKPSRRRTQTVRPQPDTDQPALLSFKWQSPTEFLLRTPGADLLKAVPRLGDSLVRFDIIPSDEKN